MRGNGIVTAVCTVAARIYCVVYGVVAVPAVTRRPLRRILS